MRNSLVFVFILIFTSCEYFKIKKTSSEAILEEELQTFNWDEVDAYPIFLECDNAASKLKRTLCFQETITNNIIANLQKEQIVVTQDINDTILLELQVSKDGKLLILDAKMDALTLQEIPNIRLLLSKSLDALPKIFPAIKRGQQVTTQFKLPISIQVN